MEILEVKKIESRLKEISIFFSYYLCNNKIKLFIIIFYIIRFVAHSNTDMKIFPKLPKIFLFSRDIQSD